MNKLCDVFDDRFDSLFLHEFYENTVSRIPYNFTNIANRKTLPYGYTGSHRLIGCNIFHRHGINDISDINWEYYPAFQDLYQSVEDIVDERFFLSSISVNLQPYGIDGTCHADAEAGEDDEFTILVMTNPIWKKEWGPASFQLLEKYDNNARVIEEYEYVPGRILIIPSPHPHRGLAPIQPYVYRTSVVFRVTPNFDKHIP